MLSERCTDVVLGSPYLLDRASLHLPRGISYFLLYLALESHNQLAVKKLVEKWPHGDLTLDFLSQSPLCRRHRCSDARCLEPHEYMGVFGSYTRYSSTEMVASLLEGVFYNLYSYHGLVGSQQHVGLRHVDMSAVVINPKQLPLLLNLVKGSVPVTHHSDYVSEREAQILGVSRPHLQNRSSSLYSEGQPPLNLLVNILLDHTTVKKTVSTLHKVCSVGQWVEVKLKGVNLLELTPAAQAQLYSHLDDILSPITDHVFLSDLSMWQRVTSVADTPLSLWLCHHALYPIPSPLNCRELLYVTSEHIESFATTLSQLTIVPQSLRALCLILGRWEYVTEDVSKVLCSLPVSVLGSLEYLQLCNWVIVSEYGLESLQLCSGLRVLSVSKNIEQPHSLFEVISKLPVLEFLHWQGGTGITSPDHLLCLHSALCSCFKSLCHFHLECSCISFDLDPEDETFPLALLPLFVENGGKKRLARDILLEWFSSLRPDVCFRVCECEVLTDPELCNAVAMDNIPRF